MDFLVQQAVEQGATNADWTEAVATVLAAVGTIGAFIWQARALRQEREARRTDIARLDREQRRLEAAQARTIALHDPRFGEDPDFGGSSRYQITVGNYGSEPISHVVGALFYRSDEKPVKLIPEIGSATRLTIVPPGETRRLLWLVPTAQVEDADVFGPEHAPDAFRADVLFTDVRGQRWSLSSGEGEVPRPHVDES